MDDPAPDSLAALREEIDRIDRDMHGLLMQRGAIIDRLIATKGTAASGSAFRPEREAAMMRELARRHTGRLPVEAAEGIWRVIISTFTHVQAPFSIHADASSDPDAMRDSARFHFGFTVPYRTVVDATAMVEAVAGSKGDLGLVAPASARGAWWRALETPAAPKIIARLPFSSRPDHPASRAILVVASGVSGEGLGAIRLYSASSPFRAEDPSRWGGEIVARAGGEALIAIPAEAAHAFEEGGMPTAVPVGSHPAP